MSHPSHEAGVASCSNVVHFNNEKYLSYYAEAKGDINGHVASCANIYAKPSIYKTVVHCIMPTKEVIVMLCADVDYEGIIRV